MENVDYHVTNWPTTNQIEIMYNTNNDFYIEQAELNGLPVDMIAKSIIQLKKKEESLDESLFKCKLCVWCIWKYRKDSLISKLPKDVLKLLCDKYISPKKEQWWITNKRKPQIKYKIYIFIIIVLFILCIIHKN